MGKGEGATLRAVLDAGGIIWAGSGAYEFLNQVGFYTAFPQALTSIYSGEQSADEAMATAQAAMAQ